MNKKNVRAKVKEGEEKEDIVVEEVSVLVR